ncbi:hypothetical protein Gotri_008152, partial [Gossypium trilobum]|nr:hypothetical protein [Gossypium trilobum]
GVNLGAWNNEISELPQAPAPTTYESPSTLVLAAQRTNRPDLLRHFKHYHGDEFHGEVLHTLKYVVNQSDYTVQILNNVTQYLSLAKTINVAELFLPSNVITDTDKLNIDLNAAADTLTEKTDENAVKIRRVFNAAIGIDLRGSSDANFGPAWSFVISDTCLAMEEWVENPHAETALSNILPCVDQRTTNHTLTQSKQVINSLVKVVNTYIYTFANSNPSPDDNRYYNQSGPSMPPLCSPFDSQLQDRQCGSNEVSMANASLVWQNFTCMVSASGLCTTTGRITPDRFMQLVAAVNESFALEHYTPLLLCLQNCDFVRDTFQKIGSNYCHPLEHYLKIVNAGLGLISVGVLLCLVLWIFYADCPCRADAITPKGRSIAMLAKRSAIHASYFALLDSSGEAPNYPVKPYDITTFNLLGSL